MVDTKTALIFTYAHLPQKMVFLANPPKDITEDKYNDLKYLKGCIKMVNGLTKIDFNTRDDGVSPYSKEVITKHFNNRIKELKDSKSK